MELTADETIVRSVIAAGRKVGREAGTTPEPTALRVVARALLPPHDETPDLHAAVESFAADPTGVERFAAMADKAAQATREHGSSDEPQLLSSHAALFATLTRAIGQRRHSVDDAIEDFADAVRSVAGATTYEEACERAAYAVRDVSRAREAALFVPGEERARFASVASTSPAVTSDDERGDLRASMLPQHARVDRGFLADVLAGDRVAVAPASDVLEPQFTADAGDGCVVAVPLRDGMGRAIGVGLARLDTRDCPSERLASLSRLAPVLAGVLAAAETARRNFAALASLPQLSDIAANDDEPVTRQLEQLAGIITQATGSDAAVVRMRDAAGRYLETHAVCSMHGDAISDLIGTRTEFGAGAPPSELGEEETQLLDSIEQAGWTRGGLRIAETLGARAIAVFPIRSLYDRGGVAYVVRRTARAFDDADIAAARIVTAHMQHIIDRHVSHVQTSHAVDAAHSAIRLLGEALVAGVRPDHTLRFVPRLYHEMFPTASCRVWRRDDSDGELVLIAGAGQAAREQAAQCVLDALDDPLRLVLDTERRPHVGAIGIEEFGGTRIAIELELQVERTLNHPDQTLVVEVAERVGEALYSAERARAHQRQLERVRFLQNIIAAAHEQLSEAHAVNTLVEHVPTHYGAQGAAVLLVDEDATLTPRMSVSMPAVFLNAISAARQWAPAAEGDERTSVLLVHELGEDDRMKPLRAGIEQAGMASDSLIVVPLLGREQTVGCFIMRFENGLPVGVEAEEATLASFGEHVGIAVLNSREHERERNARIRIERVLEVEREASRQVRALYEVSRTFANSMSLDETMRAMVEAMADRLDVDAVWLRTPDERRASMVVRAFYAPHPDLSSALERMVSVSTAFDDPVTREVWQTREPVLVASGDDTQASHVQDALRSLTPFLRRGSTLAVLPVATPAEVLGTVTMLSIDPENALTREKVDIATGVTSQAALALYAARLYQQQKHFADVIQESLLPSQLPEIPELDLGVLYRSATSGGAEVGGDFYDFMLLEDGRMALVVGDVCGKGVGAAADTAMAKYIFRALAREHPEPAAFLRFANEVVNEEISFGKFVTLFYAVIDSQKNTVVCANAGHPESKLVRVAGSGKPVVQSISLEGLALGIMPDQDYEQGEYPFPTGDSLVVYTDGVVEARRQHRLYGQYRLEHKLEEEGNASAPQIAFAVYQDCAAYAEGGLADDVAIVVVQHVPPSQAGAGA